MSLRIIFFLLAVLAIPVRPLYAQITPHKIIYLDQHTNEERAQAVLRVSRNQKEQEIIMLSLGHGTMEGFSDLRFQRVSRFKDEGYLKPLESESLFYDKEDKVVGGYRCLYDYDKSQVTFARLGADKAVEKEDVFPIEGPMADAVNLPVFLEQYLPHHEGLMQKEFYFLTAEPKVYKMDIAYRGMEMIALGDQQVYAKKIQLIANMGRFSEFTARFLPKTFVWFSPDRPYRWLQFEGQEKGPASVDVIMKQLP